MYVETQSDDINVYSNYEQQLFSLDNKHWALFDYIASDLSTISKLLEEYCSHRVDPDTFDILTLSDTDELLRIRSLLIAAHPYYQYEADFVIMRAIVRYFGKLLKYQMCWKQDRFLRFIFRESWYEALLNALIPSEWWKDRSYWLTKRDMMDYETCLRVAQSDPQTEWTAYRRIRGKISTDIPEKPVPFIDEIRAQRKIANTLYSILDMDAELFKDIPTDKRSALANLIFNLPPMAVTPQRSEGLMSRYSKSDRTDSVNLFDLEPLQEINLYREGLPEEYRDALQRVIDDDQIHDCRKPTRYLIDNLEDLLYFEIYQMIDHKEQIRKCRNCGKYFVVNNRSVHYCDRIDHTGHVCSKVGSFRVFNKKMDQEEALKIYTRAYKTHYARVAKSNMTRQELDEWRKTAKAKLDQVRSGELTLPEFKIWLKR